MRDGGRLEACRAVFGDDSQDYGAGAAAPLPEGAPADWQEHFVSAYATHPSLGGFRRDLGALPAHRRHAGDGERLRPQVAPKWRRRDDLDAEIDFDPYRRSRSSAMVEAWLPLTFAVNSLNRCMGTADLYPFVLSPPAIAKLDFVHRLMREVSRDRAKP